MPARSQAQQRFMGMVHAEKEGKLDKSKLDPEFAAKIERIAASIKAKAARDFAETKHKGLPKKKKPKKKSKRNASPPEGDSRGQNKKAEYSPRSGEKIVEVPGKKGKSQRFWPGGDTGYMLEKDSSFEKEANKWTRLGKRIYKLIDDPAEEVVKKTTKKSVKKTDDVIKKTNKVDDLELTKMYPNSQIFSGARNINYQGNNIGRIAFDPITKNMEYIHIDTPFRRQGIGTRVYDKLLKEYGSIYPSTDMSEGATAL